MIGDLKPYDAYKDAGVPWLNQVPKSWKVLRGKNVFRIIDIRSAEGEEELLTVSSADGVIPRSQKKVTMFKAESYVGHKLCWPNDLVINSLWAWMQGLGFSKHHGLVSSAYSVYRPLPHFTDYARYFHWMIRSSAYKWELQTRSKGVWTSRLQLSDIAFMDMPILVPPAEEQAAIAHFLNYADRRIRRYIRTKQKLIKLLEERKQVVINEAVTRGLDFDAPLESSELEWLGDIPSHWKLLRVKQASQILRGKFTHRPRNDPSFYGGTYPFIQTGEVARAGKKITNYRQTLNERGLAVSKMFPSGTLVMTIAANIGDVAVLDFEACFPDSIVGFIPVEEIERDYLYYLFKAMKSELLSDAPVNTQGNLNIDRVGSRKIPIPPVSEQKDIIQFIEQKVINIDRSVAHSRNEISLLREFRTRLIADIVTGKLDVREAAAKLPTEEDSEGSDLDPTEDDIGSEDDIDFDESLDDEAA